MIFKTNWTTHANTYHEIKSYLKKKYANIIETYYIQSSCPISVNIRLTGPYMYDKFTEKNSNKLCIFIFKIKKL